MTATTAPAADAASRHRAGLGYGLAAYLLWGVMPLYFKAVAHIGAGEILAHRIFWSLLFLAALVLAWRRGGAVRAALRSRRVVLTLVASAVLIGVNWLVFTLAATGGRVMEASLGYYLNPLINILLGVLMLGERLSRAQLAATVLAAAGVAVLAASAGDGLWISLTLGGSFALYGFLRKVVAVDALEGLAIESALLAPLALGWIVWLNASGTTGVAGPAAALDYSLLLLGGAVTTVPLLLFTAAARRLPLSTLGFLQYIAPTLQFGFAVWLFGEPLGAAHLICFAAIWTALAIVTVDGWRRVRARRAPAEALA